MHSKIHQYRLSYEQTTREGLEDSPKGCLTVLQIRLYSLPDFRHQQAARRDAFLDLRETVVPERASIIR